LNVGVPALVINIDTGKVIKPNIGKQNVTKKALYNALKYLYQKIRK
jgi:hypothetical protein